MKNILIRGVLMATSILSGVGAAYAADGGSGFYLLGSKGSLAGILPPEGIFYTNDLYFYSGSAEGGKRFPTIGGDLAVGLKAKAFTSVNTLLYSTPQELFGGRFAVGVALPLVDLHVDANAEFTLGGIPILGASLNDNTTALGDPVFITALGWDSGLWHATTYGTLNIPVGQWDAGALANAGFNRWAYDQTIAFTYLDPATGHELTFAPGITFNGENQDTGYDTGTEFHFEFAAMQHFSPQFAAGLVGYHYQQLTPDSGTAPSGFEGQVSALGAAINWNLQLGEVPLSLKAKYFHEFEAKNRLEGDAFFVQLAIPLYVPGATTAGLN